MKKLLLVLAVIAMVSFFLVGCIPVTPGEGEGEGEGEVEQEVTIEIEDQYPAAPAVKEYIRADYLDVTVKFTVAIPEDETVLFQAKEAWCGDCCEGDTVELSEVAGSGRMEWEYADYDFNNPSNDVCGLEELEDCDEICLYVTVVDCCDVEENEVYTEVVKLDDTPPYVTLYVTAEDCGDCDDMVNISFTSSTIGECDVEEECCGDDCSGVAEWTAKLWPIDADPVCDDYCVELSGGCPIDDSTGCVDCLVFDTDEFDGVAYWVEVSMWDNVGNMLGGPEEGLGVIVLDTDEIISIEAAPAWYDPITETWTLWDMCKQYVPPKPS